MTLRGWLYLGLRLGLGALFLYAGVIKLWDMQSLALNIANYHLVPDWAVPPLAAALPGVEVICGLCLIAGRWAKSAAWLIALMMVTFSIATGQAVARGIDLDCGCFGDGESPVTGATLLRDLALLAAALATVWTAPRDAQLETATEQPKPAD